MYIRAYISCRTYYASFRSFSEIIKEGIQHKIKKISIEDGDIFTNLDKLINLREVIIEKCNIEKFPKEIFNLKYLEKLDIIKCKLKEIPKNIDDLKNLTYLNLDNNNIEVIPNSIINLKYLDTLILTKNKLKFIPDNIGNLENLEHFDIEENKIKELPNTISNLKNLTELYICKTDIESIPALHLENCLVSANTINIFSTEETTIFINYYEFKKIISEYNFPPALKKLKLYNCYDKKLDFKLPYGCEVEVIKSPYDYYEDD